MTTIKDIMGKVIEVTDIDVAIRQCEMCKNSLFKTPSGHTVGERPHLYAGAVKTTETQPKKE
jgi:hypothetical protein